MKHVRSQQVALRSTQMASHVGRQTVNALSTQTGPARWSAKASPYVARTLGAKTSVTLSALR